MATGRNIIVIRVACQVRRLQSNCRMHSAVSPLRPGRWAPRFSAQSCSSSCSLLGA